MHIVVRVRIERIEARAEIEWLLDNIFKLFDENVLGKGLESGFLVDTE